MEFVDRIFGMKRRKQEQLLAEIGISGELKNELVGPELENASVVTIDDNEQFLKILKSEEHKQVLSHLVNQSDTHQYYEFYIDIGEGIKAKTGVASIDGSTQRTLFSDLQEMSYKPGKSRDNWITYEIGRS
jgi:hypothetical protein